MKKLDEHTTKSEREKEIKARIIRDNPQPISIGNGVHREESELAKKEADKKRLERLKEKE